MEDDNLPSVNGNVLVIVYEEKLTKAERRASFWEAHSRELEAELQAMKQLMEQARAEIEGKTNAEGKAPNVRKASPATQSRGRGKAKQSKKR